MFIRDLSLIIHNTITNRNDQRSRRVMISVILTSLNDVTICSVRFGTKSDIPTKNYEYDRHFHEKNSYLTTTNSSLCLTPTTALVISIFRLFFSVNDFGISFRSKIGSSSKWLKPNFPHFDGNIQQ